MNDIEIGDRADAPAGTIADLITAGRLSPGDRLVLTAPVLSPHSIAVILADGQLQATDGTQYPDPAALIKALRGSSYSTYAWECLTVSDGRRLATLRQVRIAEAAPHLVPAGPGALSILLAAKLLAPATR